LPTATSARGGGNCSARTSSPRVVSGVDDGDAPSARSCDGLPDQLRVVVELWPVPLEGCRDDVPAVTRVAGDDVQVEVEHRLECRLAVADGQVDAFAAQLRPPQGASHLRTYWPHGTAGLEVQILEANGVNTWYDEEVTGDD